MTRKASIKDEFAQAVADHLLIEQTALIPADFALVFGNKNIIEPLAQRTADLYHPGHFPLIVASGGVKTKSRLTEAEALRRALVRKGVPNSAIIPETQAAHTGENVLLTRALLEDKGLAQTFSSVISIGHIIAGRRFLMTLERHWPEIHKMQASVNPFDVPARDWHTHETFRRHTVKEWRKLAPYQAQDLIREVDIAALNRATAYIKAFRGLASSSTRPSPVPGSGSPQPA